MDKLAASIEGDSLLLSSLEMRAFDQHLRHSASPLLLMQWEQFHCNARPGARLTDAQS
jgi:hypothetical protein